LCRQRGTFRLSWRGPRFAAKTVKHDFRICQAFIVLMAAIGRPLPSMVSSRPAIRVQQGDLWLEVLPPSPGCSVRSRMPVPADTRQETWRVLTPQSINGLHGLRICWPVTKHVWFQPVLVRYRCGNPHIDAGGHCNSRWQGCFS
jgi:hypothetical protein